jgi:proteic killer suppression protein
MIRSFKNAATEDIFNGINSKASRKACPQSLWKIAVRKLDQIDSAEVLDDLRIPPGNRLEALKGDRQACLPRRRQGQHSIRINEQYRICFVWTEAGPEEVEIVDYH